MRISSSLLLAVDATGGFRFPLGLDSILRVLGLGVGFLLAFFRDFILILYI